MTKPLDKTELDKYNKFTSESGHWYSLEGEPMYTIIGANGKERNTTLRDAKSIGLVPSVTTILSMVAKPALENWKITQAIKSAVTLDIGDEESMDSFVYRCKSNAKQIGSKAAKDSFCANQGYGGKIDLYSKSGIFVDFKTKDNLEGKDPAKLVYDEHGMQLSAYAQGCNIDNPTRVSIFVDRADTSLVLCHIWDEESHEKHKEMFNSILKYWQLVNNYEWQEV